jgi:hydroxymethylglutaryl-CoA reductase (NADPH)
VNISSTSLSTILNRIGEDIPTGELVVKVHSPVHVRVADSTLERRSTSEEDDDEVMDDGGNTNRFENFMSFWTTIVSDPVMSKWIVLTLAASVFLNGYLLKGLGSSTLQRLQAQHSTTVLLEHVRTKSPESPSSTTTYDHTHTNGTAIAHTHTTEGRPDPVPLPPVPVLSPPDAKADAPLAPEPVERRSDLEPCRSLGECLQVFSSGPDGVQRLNNEEVILLAQQGKIAAYALEKVLGDLERAVLIRRALICKSSSLPCSVVPAGHVACLSDAALTHGVASFFL